MKTLRIFVGLLVVVSLPIAAQQASTLDELLQNVEQGMTQDASDNQKRENEFRQKRGQQEALLSESTATKVKEEERSAKLENVFEDNEKELNELTETLNERLGALKELFGVMQQVAGDARSRFDISLTNVQFPNRGNFLENLAKKLGSSSKLPSIEEIEKLWFELQREMTETGKVVNSPPLLLIHRAAKIKLQLFEWVLLILLQMANTLTMNQQRVTSLKFQDNPKAEDTPAVHLNSLIQPVGKLFLV